MSEITYFSQKDENHCGPCCMSMILSSMGIKLPPEEIIQVVMQRRISDRFETAGISNICSELSHYGVYPIAIFNMPEKNAWEYLKNTVDTRGPVMVSQVKDENTTYGHGRVVTKIVKNGTTFTIHCLDPDEKEPITEMTKERFMNLWGTSKEIGKPAKYEMIVIGKNRSKLQREKCYICNSSDIDEHSRRFDHPEMEFINPQARERMNGTVFKCRKCSTEFHHYP